MARRPTTPPADDAGADDASAPESPFRIVRVHVDPDAPDAFRRRPSKPRPVRLRSRAEVVLSIAVRQDTAPGRREVIAQATDDPELRAELLAELDAELAEEEAADLAALAQLDRLDGDPEGTA